MTTNHSKLPVFARRGSSVIRRAALLVLMTAVSLHAAPEEGTEGKLRDALRNTVLKLRDAQGQVAAAQAAQIAAEDKIKDLADKNGTLTKDLLAERITSANRIAGLNAKLEERDKTLTALQATVQKWKKSYSEITALAAKKESERGKLEAKSLKLERQVASQQVKNLEMYKAGMDTLDRYEKFGLGDALLAREPFVGNTKVKFANLVQDQADKLTDARIKPGDAEAQPSPTPAPKTKS